MTRLAILAAVLLLAACSGGGGGGGNGASGSGSGGGGSDGTGSGGTGDGGTGGGGTGGGSSTGPGSAAILFPLPHSGATSATLVVRGTASDPDGVARVLVNGVSATLETAAASEGEEIADAKIRIAPAASSWPRKGTASTLAEDADTEVEWSAEVDLEGGENEISVSVEDSLAAATEDADSAVVDYLEVPVDFTLDAAQSRVVGVSSTSTWNGVVRHLVEHDFLTQRQIIHAAPDPSPGCLSTGTREFQSLVLDMNGTWAIHRVSLEDDAELSAVSIPSGVLDPGPGFRADPFMMRLVCTPEGEKSYVLVDYTDDAGGGIGDSGFAKSRILEVQLSPPAVSVLSETDPTAPTPWIAEDLALWDGALVGLHGVNASAPLTRTDLADLTKGERSDLTPGLDVGGVELAPAPTQGLIYVVRVDDQVDEIDVARGARRTVSAPDPASPFAFGDVRSAAFDAANGRVIVGDSSLDALVAVNTASGERSDFLSHRIGSGVPLISPRRIAVSSDGSKAYVADDGDNAAERLFEIDLATGDRRVVGDIDLLFNVPVTGMALDEPGERVYVSFPTSVVAVDIASGAVQTVTNDGLLTAIGDLALDAEKGRLLITDFASGAIVAVDVATHEQTTFSKAGEQGTGDGLSGPTSLSIDSESSVLYVVDSNAGDVMRVDLESGDREVAIGECSIGGSNLLPHDGQFGQVLFNANGNELLILGDAPLRVDLGTSLCGRIWPARPAPTLLAFALTPNDQLLAVTFGQLLQLDRRSVSGQLVVVSR